MESPVAKMIKFLRRYQESHFCLRKPTIAEACELEDLIFRQGGHLNEPDVEAQLSAHSEIKPAVVAHLLSEYYEKPSTHVAGPTDKQVYRYRSPSASLESQSLPPLPGGDQPHDSTATGHDPPRMKKYLAAQNPLPIGAVTVPHELQQAVAQDFFLDCVTLESPVRTLDFPLVTILVQSISAFGSVQCTRWQWDGRAPGAVHQGGERRLCYRRLSLLPPCRRRDQPHCSNPSTHWNRKGISYSGS